MIAALVLQLAALFSQPSSAQCPRSWFVEGLSPRGEWTCHRAPIGRGENDDPQPAGELRGRIYCTNGFLPVVVSSRSVGCQRTGWVQR